MKNTSTFFFLFYSVGDRIVSKCMLNEKSGRRNFEYARDKVTHNINRLVTNINSPIGNRSLIDFFSYSTEVKGRKKE